MNSVRADSDGATDMALLPVQLPSSPQGAAQARGRFYNSGNAFDQKLPDVPAAVFVAEPGAALAGKKTGLLPCDQSHQLGTPFAATTPLMLARYAVIGPDDTLDTKFVATGTIWYAIAGSGYTRAGDETFEWNSGDVFLTPGGAEVTLTASATGAVLWLVTNEPQLAFDRLAPLPGDGPVEAVHYPAGEIAQQLERVVNAGQNAATAGIALIFSTARQAAARNIMPSLTLSLNTVPAGEQQRPHRHNSAAITLILKGRACYSLVGTGRCDWSPYATLVTPATQPHSHHNESAERALFLIVQDGGLYYHARTMGFAFLESQG